MPSGSSVGHPPPKRSSVLRLRGSALQARVSGTLELLGLSEYADHPPAVLGYGLMIIRQLADDFSQSRINHQNHWHLRFDARAEIDA